MTGYSSSGSVEVGVGVGTASSETAVSATAVSLPDASSPPLFLLASRLFRRSSASVAFFSSASAASLATLASRTMSLCAATSFSSLADSSSHRRLSAGAPSRIFLLASTPPRALRTLARISSRLDAPNARHVFGHRAGPSCSSVPSQQSHTPSLTRDEKIVVGAPGRLAQRKSVSGQAPVSGSSERSASQSQ